MADVTIGVDPHKLSATIEVVDQDGVLLGAGRFATDNAGHGDAALREDVAAAGEHVLDVPAKLTARVRLFDTVTTARPTPSMPTRSRCPPCAPRA